LKGRKNATEQGWLRKVMVKDGVAVSRFIKWIEDNIGKNKITELSASKRLHEFRAEQDLFVGDSFPAISSYRGNGAIIHYKVSEASDTELHPNGIYLIDSGGQYIDGTTDITRTLTLGETTEEEKRCYTLVLKGHIGVAALKFPEGTRGNQIDVMARQPLWQYGLNFAHGTGHGVGFFMNVHEGPHRIGPGAGGAYNLPIIAGMYSSNEPGFYKEGAFGMRIENLMITQKAEETDFGKFLDFETITLAPLENKLVDVNLLTKSERKWYNDYHAEVLEKLGSEMNDEERAWLAEKCQAI
jgi:Xaa-Pro aminopeptidase